MVILNNLHDSRFSAYIADTDWATNATCLITLGLDYFTVVEVEAAALLIAYHAAAKERGQISSTYSPYNMHSDQRCTDSCTEIN